MAESTMESVLVKLQVFNMNGNFLADYVTESVFSLRWCPSLFLVKFQTFTINGNDRVCDGVCF